MTAFVPERIHVEPDRSRMGAIAARNIADTFRDLLSRQPGVRAIFAAAPSQSEMLASLRQQPEIDWARVIAFHMDEYIGLPEVAPPNFRSWRRELFDHLPLRAEYLKPGNDPAESAQQYGRRLAEAPIDIVCLGIGVNGHLSFNDPPADFADLENTRLVKLQEASREQQVSDGCFRTLDEVPTPAITLTIPRLLRASKLFCCVPGAIKREAVRRAFTGSVDPASPASILRTHPLCNTYLDADSASSLGPIRDEVRGRSPVTGAGVVVTVEGDRIIEVRACPARQREPWLTAGLIDLQSNGFAGIDLNDGCCDAAHVVALCGLWRVPAQRPSCPRSPRPRRSR